ncbi:hypothetical protein HGRIS_004822 [Hohenbuehelia grisea]|uniref:Uncharacterized protein n=1 Tax=Hohenbuehelia grisea TaxID=104357 RepID=A0ABR3JD29_9AGAR
MCASPMSASVRFAMVHYIFHSFSLNILPPPTFYRRLEAISVHTFEPLQSSITFHNYAMSSFTTSSPLASATTTQPFSTPIILALLLATFAFFSGFAFTLLFICRGRFASMRTKDVEKGVVYETKGSEKSSTIFEKLAHRLSVRGLPIVRLATYNNYFPLNTSDLMPTRRAPVFDQESGTVIYPSHLVTPSTPKKSSRFSPTRLELAAAYSAIPVLQFTPPTPHKGRKVSTEGELICKGTLHPLYGSLAKDYILPVESLAEPSSPSSDVFF